MTKLQLRLEKHHRKQARGHLIKHLFSSLFGWGKRPRPATSATAGGDRVGGEIQAVIEQPPGGQDAAAMTAAAGTLHASATTRTGEKSGRAAARRPTLARRAAALLGKVAFALMLFVMAFLVFSMVQSRLSGGVPTVAGHQIYIVKGGSMSPTFEAGSLAFVRPVDPGEIAPGAIITYSSAGDGEILTTHRVVAVNREEAALSFTTRGDANEVNDPLPLRPEKIVGEVAFTVPYAGYLMHFGQTQAGIVVLVFIPGIIIIAFELRNLIRLATKWEEEKERRKRITDPSVPEEAKS